MNRFEDLPANIKALLLARLAMELKAHHCTSLLQLSMQHHTDVAGVWRRICRLAKQPTCTVPEAGLPQH